MASGVFGNPITNLTLEAMPQYMGKTITRLDRAKVALDMKNAEGKDVNAEKFVENLKQQYGNGVSTLCMVYNATGDTIKYSISHDWHGHLWKGSYPHDIANGQFAAFLHVHPSGAAVGSAGGVAYHGLNNAGDGRDWMCSWSIPWIGSSKAYTEVRERDHFTGNVWGTIERKMGNSGLVSDDEWGGCVSSVTIGNNTTAFYNAIFTLEGADKE